ncbi:MAG: fibronectin type III domain-containing protein, partial [Nitrososphaerales archaeon]
EFVLLRDEGFEIQARQTAVETEGPLGPNAYTGLTSCVSINTAAAVRAGAHRITYEPDLSGKPNPEGLQLRVDGELVQLSATGVPLGPDGRIIRTPAQGGIQIEGAGGAVVTITPGWWDYYQLWYLNIDTRSVRATQGIMGAIAPGNWLPALPDGSFLGPMPADLNQRYSDLYDKFGKSWRVSDATTLFDYAPGASTGTFTLDSWPLGESPKDCVLPPGLGSGKPPMKTLPAEVAKQVCSNIASEERRAFCEQDVMVTGEAGFAKTYLETEAVGRNAIPSAPVLVSPEPFATGLAGPITFAWREAKDPDQDKVLYRLYVWPVDETPDNNKAVPVPENLSYTISRLEPGRAYFWKVIAEDGKGGTVESQTRRFEMK